MFSNKQQLAFNSYKNGENIFITGAGGCGKSYIIKQIYKDAKKCNKKISVTAMTGCAAILLECGATTLHSWGNIGIGNEDYDKILKKIYMYKKKDNWLNTDILIIDEISMMSQYIFEMIDYISKHIRKSKEPFGGIQIICSGDFYQLPPVAINTQEQSKKNFCFESPLWDITFDKNIIFNENFRQSNDEEYVNILEEIRNNNLSIDSIEKLLQRCNKNMNKDEINKDATILYPVKRMSDKYNDDQFKKLLESNRFVNVHVFIPKFYKYNKITKKYDYLNKDTLANKSIKERCTKSFLLENELKLCIGTKVMVTANIDITNNIVNGSQGIIVNFVNNLPEVKFNNITKIIEPYSWKTNDENYQVEQIPLILSWAITIHKAQGITLDCVRINLGNSVFEYGQTYVALSRVKSLNGLYLDSIDFKKIKTNRKVINFYKNINI